MIARRPLGRASVVENAGAGELALEPGDIRRIEAAFPKGRPRKGVPTI